MYPSNTQKILVFQFNVFIFCVCYSIYPPIVEQFWKGVSLQNGSKVVPYNMYSCGIATFPVKLQIGIIAWSHGLPNMFCGRFVFCFLLERGQCHVSNSCILYYDIIALVQTIVNWLVSGKLKSIIALPAIDMLGIWISLGNVYTVI